MEIIRYNGNFPVDKAVELDGLLIAAVSFDGKTAAVSHIDESVEHYILLDKAGLNSADIDKYFRITFDKSGADWTFVCPADYKGIADRTRRIGEFYRDGFTRVSEFLTDMGYFIDLRIPKRYRRHFKELGE